jgi:hypothetical protein
MYVTEISAFCTVNMKFFIQSTLAKKKKIYSDRTIIFIAMYTLNVSKCVALHKNCVYTEASLAKGIYRVSQEECARLRENVP